MYGGVNVGIYAERADMYIRYRELGGSWVYLKNVKNSYMPNPQIFKYEVQVDSVDRVDVYWKDIGQGSISYRYHYVEFVHDCPVPSPTKTATPSMSNTRSPSPSASASLYCPEPNHPSCEEVELNIQSDTSTETDAILDTSKNAHTITKNGDVKHTSEVKVLGESSLYFDGNGDYLSVGDESTFKYLHDGTTDYL